jgi:predicted HicB family RNase H-like nuclease
MPALTVRYGDELHTKLRVLAAFRDVSLNALVVEAMEEKVAQWEAKYGPLPLPPEDIK